MVNSVNKKLVAALLVSVSLAACAVGPDYKKPATDLPQEWPWHKEAAMTNGGSPQDVIAPNWWQEFQDPALTALIEEGLDANADLVTAAARVSQARAMLTIKEADLYPSLDAQANASRTSNSEMARMGGFALNSKPFNDFGLGAVLNYELDLWGRLRRSKESAKAQLLSVKANRDAIRLAVVSNIAISYFNLRALDAQLDITNNTIASRKDALEFQRKQYDMGGENALTFHQAEAELADAQAQKPALEQARLEQETALSVLLGRSPRDILDGVINAGKSVDTLSVVPKLPNDLPSTLLERRPDIYAAEQSLVAANADIGVAKADYFPRLSLSSLLGLNATDIDNVLKSHARRWQLAGTASVPLVDFGKRSANVESAEAGRDIALAGYEQTVRVAFKEVIDALSSETTSTARERAQIRQMTSRAESLRLSDLRYKSGYSNYLEVLDAQRFLHTAQLARVTAKRDRLIAVVNLYRSLGGGWSETGAAPVLSPVTVQRTALQPVTIGSTSQDSAVAQAKAAEPIKAEPVIDVKASEPKIDATPVTKTEAAPKAEPAPKAAVKKAKPVPVDTRPPVSVAERVRTNTTHLPDEMME